MATEIGGQLGSIESRLAELEEQRLFSGEHDAGDAVVTVRSGAGGTYSQDWAEMLLRMYLRWAESRGFAVEIKEASEGEEAGLKLRYLPGSRRERLRPVRGRARRPSAGPDLALRLQSRRHTAFAQLEVSPLVADDIEVSSTRPTSASTPTGPRERVVSTSTRPTRRSGSPTCRPGSSSSARTSVRRRRTRPPRCRCSGPGCSPRRSASAPRRWRSSAGAEVGRMGLADPQLHPPSDHQGQGSPHRSRGRRRAAGPRRRSRRLRSRVLASGRRLRSGAGVSVDASVTELVTRALAEDLGDGDRTTDAIVPAEARHGRGSSRRRPAWCSGSRRPPRRSA